MVLSRKYVLDTEDFAYVYKTLVGHLTFFSVSKLSGGL